MTSAQPSAQSTQAETDARWMRQALVLAEESIGLATPNPVVGCVLVRDDTAVGRGAHIYDQLDHAEIVALRNAGEQARGATAYVTLEPCAHTGRTGPCAEALVRAGVRRVVVATSDPNPLVSGRGLARLREAGIVVSVGVLAEQARRLNNGFARYIRRKLPFVTLKAGLSLDGRIAPAPGEPAAVQESDRSQGSTIYLTSTRSLIAVQRMRHASDAILTGIGTVLTDNPLLTDRSNLPRRRPLLRVVLDSTLRLPLHSRIVQSAQQRPPQTIETEESGARALQPDLLVFTRDAGTARAEALRGAGVAVEELPLLPATEASSGAARLDLRPMLVALGEQRGMLNLLVEGGSHLNRVLLESDLVDKLCLFYAPLFLGEGGVPLVAGKSSLHPEMHRTSLTSSGDDFCFEAYLRDSWR